MTSSNSTAEQPKRTNDHYISQTYLRHFSPFEEPMKHWLTVYDIKQKKFSKKHTKHICAELGHDVILCTELIQALKATNPDITNLEQHLETQDKANRKATEQAESSWNSVVEKLDEGILTNLSKSFMANLIAHFIHTTKSCQQIVI